MFVTLTVLVYCITVQRAYVFGGSLVLDNTRVPNGQKLRQMCNDRDLTSVACRDLTVPLHFYGVSNYAKARR